MVGRRSLVRRRHRPLRIGVEQRLFELPPHTGHGRVWTEVLPRLAQMADVVVDCPTPDVWIIDGHNGDPGVQGPVVACVYEVGWGTPALDEDYAPGFVDRIARGTEDAVKRSDRIVTGARSSKSQIVDAYGVPEHRVHVVSFGVDLVVFNPGNGAGHRDLVRDRTGEDRPYVLFVSSLHPRKNLRAVREAVVGLARRGYPHVLVIVAAPAPDRDDSSDLEEQAFAELPGFPGRVIRFIDPPDGELSALMGGADVMCQPSKAEGFGLTVLEAMAAGTPVIVSNRGSLPGVVGRAGRIVDPTPTAVEDALVDIITHPTIAARMSKRAVRRASRLSWDRTAEGWLRVARQAARLGGSR